MLPRSVLLALAATLAAPGDAPGAPAPAGAPVPSGIFPLSAVHRGLEVTAYTVFAGNEVEPFHGRVLGVARSFIGPDRDAVLVEFLDERVRHTGIVHGMSGSPVYVGDRVLGAVSLVLSPFPKDPVAGVTPIEYMLADAAEGPGQEAAAPAPPPREGARVPRTIAPLPGGTLGARPGDPSRAPSKGLPNGGLVWPVASAAPHTPSAAAGLWPALVPLLAPVVASSLRPEVLERFRPRFAALGLDLRSGGGGTDPASPLGPADLRPGAAVAAVLASGDLNLDATGTITWRDGNRLLAFGHPFLLLGRVALPMAPAEVVTTLADQFYAYKVTNTGVTAGTVQLDRLTTIVGEVGAPPVTIPMSLRLVRGGADIASYRFQVSEDRWLTPLVVELLVATALALREDYDQEATYRLRGVVRLDGRPEVVLHDTYAVAPDPRTASTEILAADVGQTMAALYLNPFAAPAVTAIDLVYETEPRGRIDRLEGVFLDPERVRAGETARARVAVRGLRGERRLTTIDVPIPAGAAGQILALRIADAALVRAEAVQAGSPLERVASLDQLVEILSERPRSDRLYVQLLAPQPDSILYHKRLPSLPGSVVEVLERGSGPFRRLPRAVVWEGTLATEGMAVGAQEIQIEVRP